MDIWALWTNQLTDPFRIALLVGLAWTMHRTRGTTGLVVPALAGIVFVALLIPMTMATSAPFWPQMVAGLLSNTLLLAAILGLGRIAMRILR